MLRSMWARFPSQVPKRGNSQIQVLPDMPQANQERKSNQENFHVMSSFPWICQGHANATEGGCKAQKHIVRPACQKALDRGAQSYDQDRTVPVHSSGFVILSVYR